MQVEISFKTSTSEKAFLISSSNCFFNGCDVERPSIHLGNLIAILFTGNSYRTLENILLISSKFKFAQFIGITLLLYFCDIFQHFFAQNLLFLLKIGLI